MAKSKRKQGTCIYDRINILCDERKCKNCGWNPANMTLRRERAEKVVKNRKLPQKREREADDRGYYRKKIYCVETGETFPSVTAAAKAFGISTAAVSSCVNGLYPTVKGYHFEGRDNEDG